MEFQSKNILLTAFQNSSAVDLIENAVGYTTMFLPNNKIADSQKLIDYIDKNKFDYIISIGQRPNIKDKVHIETTAKKSDRLIHTDFNYSKLKMLFENNGLVSKISNNAGTSFCNELYFNGLTYLSQNKMTTQMVFIHIPFEKNISNFTDFCKHFYKTLTDWQALNNPSLLLL